MRTGSRSPGRPAIASRDGGRASRQRGADCGRALRVQTPTPAPDRAQTPDSRFSARRSFPRLPRPKVPQAPNNPCPGHGDPLRQRCTYAGRFPARCRGNGPAMERREGQASCSAITRRAEQEKKVCVFLRCPLVVGGSSIADIACLRKRIHSLHQIQDDGYLREAGERRGKSEGYNREGNYKPVTLKSGCTRESSGEL